jgi:phenylacetate-CoA ligase
MIDEVPLYAGRPAPPETDEPAALSAWLASMPLVHKRDFRRGFPKSLVRKRHDLKTEMARGAVEIIATSGTTEDRLQVLWEWTWWDPQEREAMRLNPRIRAAMPENRAHFREAVLTTPVCGGSTCHVGTSAREERTIDGMLFLNQVADPSYWNRAELDRMVTEWNDLQPEGVEADPAYLAALCRYARESGQQMHSPIFVTLTYELPTRAHRRDIGRVLDSPLYTLFGATEAGVLFMECDRGRLHHNVRHSHIELEPLEGDLHRVVVTSLGRAWMPLLRYALNDVVRLSKTSGPCGCGFDQGGFTLSRIEGRFSDCLQRPSGLITPAMIDDVIDEVDTALHAWQLSTDGEGGGFLLRVVGSDGRTAAARVAKLIGAKVEARAEAAILPEGSGKYRLVRA